VNQDRRGDGVWLLLFLALLVGAKPAADAASPPTSTSGPKTRQYAKPATPLAPSPAARAGIPANYLALYRASARTCPGLAWGVLAGIGKVESDHGRSRAPGVRAGANAFGCCAGPMQFNIRNGPPSTWDRYGRGGNVYDPRDAIPAAARLLCANGAQGGRDVRGAVYAYNHASWYVAQVLALARAYQAGGGS
jgi:Transglycosylase SLT domain